MFFIVPAIASALSTIATAISTIGPAAVNFCVNVLPKLGPLLSQGLEALKVVSQIVNTVAQVFGIFRPEETAEDIGDRALQAAQKGITPERFDDHAQYMDALRDFDLDRAKSDQTPTATKIMAGMALAGNGLDEKFNAPDGTMGNLWVLAAASPGFFTADTLTMFLKSRTSVADMVDYFEGKLGGGEALDVEDALVSQLQPLMPGSDEQSIREKIYGAADALHQYSTSP